MVRFQKCCKVPSLNWEKLALYSFCSWGNCQRVSELAHGYLVSKYRNRDLGEWILHLRFSLKKLHSVYLFKHLVECHFGLDGGYREWGDAVSLWHLATPLPALALCPGWAQNVGMRGRIPGRCMLRWLMPASGAWEALSPLPGLGLGGFASGGCGFSPDLLPQPLGPSARLVSAPRDCLVFASPLTAGSLCSSGPPGEQRMAGFVWVAASLLVQYHSQEAPGF